MFSVYFWGVRGSIPCPGHDTVDFGGNTTCLELRIEDKLIIIDLGTGVKPLGDKLMATDFKKGPLDIDIFISHTHSDHIMGFPMFAPIFVPGTKMRIRGPVSYNDDSLASIIGDQLSYRYWPVRQSELAAKIEYEELKETTINMGNGLKVTTKYMNHPILCLGYRFEYQGKSIVTAFDHEPYRNLFPTDPNDPSYNEEAAYDGEAAAKEENSRILKFIYGADILIHDTQFASAEYEKRLGWGHSSYKIGVNTALQAKVKSLVFFHHDPNATDKFLHTIEQKYQNELKEKSDLKIIMAREGLRLDA
jgi:ribonuclease BN (tRNA processing enzyme)